MAVFFIKHVLILHLVIISDIFMQVSSTEEINLRSAQIYTCPKGAYLDMTKNRTACRACTVCPAGYGVGVPCSLTTDTVCEPCAEGTYNPRKTLNERCRRCRRCSYPYVSVRKCQPNRDASCNWCAKAEEERQRKAINTTETSEVTSTLAAILDTQTLQSLEIHTSEEGLTLEMIVVIIVMIMMLMAVIFLIAFCILRDSHRDVLRVLRVKKRRNYATRTPVSTFDGVQSKGMCFGKQPRFVADEQAGGIRTCVVDLPEKVSLK
ncbi:tumor necrosis factor receptor superfamily member 16-like [Lineus longissimus]|uniref:tumor necrosis factor receptor superfamily member 16-like n=1 Tax=Lineus longissimus TaxID=88925 RepID=UPI002B4C36FA